MQTQMQGKIFIVIGSLGLLLALYFLITAFFPTTPSIQEQISTITEQTGSTGDVGQPDFNELLLATQNGLTIHVLIPEFLFTTGFEEIAQDIKENESIKTEFFLPNSIDAYKQIDGSREYSGQTMDIMMVPVDYIYKFIEQSRAISIAEKIGPYYNPEFTPIIDREEYTFVPHAIDPAVIFSQVEQTPPSTIHDRLDMVSNRQAPKKYHVPLAFGIGEQDRLFLKQGRESFTDNFFFFYHIIKYIIQGESPLEDLKTLIDIPNIAKSDARNIADFISISNKLAERNSYCKIYPSICVFNYNFTNHRFGFISDISKIQKYFSIQEYNISPFWHTNSYPARGRGFLIHKSDTTSENKLKNIAYFLESYIQSSLVDANPSLWDSTIPAGNAASTTINNQKIPSELFNNTNRKIFIGDGSTAKIFTTETPILDVLGGKYNPELFLENLSRQF